MMGNSTFWANDDVYLYELDLDENGRRAVLDGMLAATHRIQDQPQWYNTIFSNCTNVLARAVNGASPGAVPHHYAWYLPGYADEFLHDKGFLAGDDAFENLVERAHVTPLVPDLYSITDPVAFSRELRRRMGA